MNEIKAGDYLSPKNSWECMLAYVVIAKTDNIITALSIPKNDNKSISLASVVNLDHDDYEIMTQEQATAVRWSIEATIINAKLQIDAAMSIKNQIASIAPENGDTQ